MIIPQEHNSPFCALGNKSSRCDVAQNGLLFRKPAFPFHYLLRNPAVRTISPGYKNTDIIPNRFRYLGNILVCKSRAEQD